MWIFSALTKGHTTMQTQDWVKWAGQFYRKIGPTVIGQEDCLVLNIYVPRNVYNDPSSKAPVMVFVHGGGLVSSELRLRTVNPWNMHP